MSVDEIQEKFKMTRGRLMKILVCFKVVYDLETVFEDDWQKLARGELEINYTKKILNCFDESALELGLCMADQAKALGRECEITALTVGGQSADPFIKNLYAVNYSSVVYAQCDADLRFNHRALARIIARYAERAGGFDALLLGCQANMGDSGQIPFLTAELLALPLVHMVTDIDLAPHGFNVKSQIEAGMKRMTVTAPAVYSVGNAKNHAYLRVATLREKLNAAKKTPIHLTLADLDFTEDDLKDDDDNAVIRLYRDKKTRECAWIEAGTAAEKAKILYETYMNGVIHK